MSENREQWPDQQLKRLLIMLLVTCTVLFFLITLVHEFGHALVAISLGQGVTDFVITLDGGSVRVVYVIQNQVEYGRVAAMIGMSGGLAVALLFTFIGFFSKPFLILVPVNIIDGFAEALYMTFLHHNFANLNTILMVFIIGFILGIKMRNENRMTKKVGKEDAV